MWWLTGYRGVDPDVECETEEEYLAAEEAARDAWAAECDRQYEEWRDRQWENTL